MIKTINVKLARRPYPIYIGKDALGSLSRLIKKSGLGVDAVIITTAPIHKICGERVKKELKKACRSTLVLTVPDSEKSKNAGLALRLIGRITRFDVGKDLFIVALGGGVVGDLSGFIAAIYKRGIPYIQVPTTLLAQIDSSIGGKTAIDTAFGKNLIGAFYQPRFVLSDVGLLKTLPKDQVRFGLAEAVKYAVIKDGRLFNYLEKNFKKILSLHPASVTHLIERCAAIKADVVARDEFDKKGIRVILNFGHTFAHGLEAASGFKLSHGQAVAIGMACACALSRRFGYLDEKEASRIVSLLKDIGLPTRIKGMPPAAVWKAMAHDKKFFRGINRFVLIEKIGKTRIAENIPQETVKKILSETAA